MYSAIVFVGGDVACDDLLDKVQVSFSVFISHVGIRLMGSTVPRLWDRVKQNGLDCDSSNSNLLAIPVGGWAGFYSLAKV